VRRTGASAPPAPDGVRTADELVARLRELHSWAGVSYHEIHRRVTASRRRRRVTELPAYNTVYRCLQPGRSRLDVELVVDIAAALLNDESHVASWRQAHQVVVGRAAEAGIVTVADSIPLDQDAFVGRSQEVEDLLKAYRAGTTRFVIGGMAGAGKTRLARHLAHRLLAYGQGTDLQLSVDLRGFDPDRPPADPAAVLEGFLRRLGVPGSQVLCLDLAGRVRRFQQLAAERKAIVLLDNAASEDQVAPLLAPGPDCITLVTSRYQLGGSPDIKSLALKVFSPEESLELLAETVGQETIATDRATALRIAELVGHLPLALAVVAARLTDLPGWTLVDHLERLTEHRERLRLEDQVGPALALSYEALPPERRRLLRLLALHPGRDFDSYAVAAAADQPRAVVERELAELVQSSLVQLGAPGRYGLHDLVRVFASDRSRDEDQGAARRDALARLFDYYRWTAGRAAVGYAPHEGGRLKIVDDPGYEIPPVETRDEARAWLDTERTTLITVACGAAEIGRPLPVTDLSRSIHYYLDTSGYFREAQVLHESAVAVADEDITRSRAENNLGCVYWRQGRYAEGRACYERALVLTRKLGNREGVARCLGNVALGHFRLGHYEQAIDCFEQALAIFEEEGALHITSVCTNRGGLGWALLRLDRIEEALVEFKRSLQTARRLGDNTFEEAYALVNLGIAYERMGLLKEATDYGEAALVLSHKLDFRTNIPDCTNLLGKVKLATDPAAAVQLQQEALDLTVETGNRALMVEIRNDLGVSLRRAGRIQEALEQHQLALVDAESLADPYEIARARRGLAD
jgi:tetratricopeptide (TPR) repeat protein